MKRRLQLLSVVLIAVFFVSQSPVHAAAVLPPAAVWFAPAGAVAGSTITLNALVYNNQSVDATVTVVFSSPVSTVATVTKTVAAQSAATVSVDWKMPVTNTVVTATVSTALDKNKKALPALVGSIGTVIVGNSPTPVITTLTFPGSTQLNAWFNPLLSQIEAFRAKEAINFTAARNTARVKLGLTAVPPPILTVPETPAPAVDIVHSSQGAASIALGNPGQYFTVLYTTALASLFSSQLAFYLVGGVLILLVLRFIVNLIF
jgi:hypothetical protein